MQKVIDGAKFPASIVANYQGTAAAFQGSLSNEGILILAALVTVYIVLGVLYESYIHPITILSTLPSAGVGAILALLFAYAMSWACACLGLVSKGPESAQSMGLLILFPLAFVSNAMVPTQHMPSWLRVLADWNPVSAVASALRNLWGNPNPSATIHAWPMQHPVWAALLWSAAILLVCGPLAVRLYRRRTTG